MVEMLMCTIIILLALAIWLYRLNRNYCVMACFTKRLKTIDGTPLELTVPMAAGRTIFANVFDFIGLDNVAVFEKSRRIAAELGKSYLQYGLFIPFYNIITAEDAELVVSDPHLTTKGIVYNFLHPFLHTGLLTSADKKWHTRRKMLTPAFHFNILGQFEEVFKEESHKFVENMKEHLKTTSTVLLSEIISKFTLNSVCEAALGVQLDERLDDAEYRASFKMIEEVFVERIGNPFYMIDLIYSIVLAPKIENHLRIVHEFSSNIIQKRRQLLAEQQHRVNLGEQQQDTDFEFIKKKRYAMLDTLLHAERDGQIDHAGICEEVDTFMFEGFDTTSMGLTFALMNLSMYPEMQERCYQEIIDYVNDDLSLLDIDQLNGLKYLECFIKETLRLYPSVPVIMRQAVREMRLANNLILPQNTQIVIHIFDIHRSSKYFTEPLVFDPERFTSERAASRHAFAYMPFSAGQRNCIGQKFAMLEMKTLLVYVLKQFKILPLMHPKDLVFETGIIIRTPNLIKVRFVARK